MFEGMDQLLGESLEMATTSHWRWLRVACTAALVVVALALLTVSLWWPR
jgi:hypothetical protein